MSFAIAKVPAKHPAKSQQTLKMKLNMNMNMKMNIKMILQKEEKKMNVSIEKKQEVEAVARMKALGLYGPTIRQFQKEGLVSISEPPVGAFFWVEGD